VLVAGYAAPVWHPLSHCRGSPTQITEKLSGSRIGDPTAETHILAQRSSTAIRDPFKQIALDKAEQWLSAKPDEIRLPVALAARDALAGPAFLLLLVNRLPAPNLWTLFPTGRGRLRLWWTPPPPTTTAV